MIGTILAHLFLSKHNSYLKIYSVYVTIELHYQKRNIAVRSHLVKWTIINSKTNCSVAYFHNTFNSCWETDAISAKKKINIDIFSKRMYFPSFMSHPLYLKNYVYFIFILYTKYGKSVKKRKKLNARYSIIIKKFIFFKRSFKNIALKVLQ